MSKFSTGVFVGGLAGAAAGFVAGVMLAPRSGAESRAMAADAMNDAWDSAVDTYERGSQAVTGKINDVRPSMDATTDELRAKVDLARERRDQLRESLAHASATQVDAAESSAEPAAEPTVVPVTEEPAEPAGDDAAEK